jgi:hypothetical protein
MTDAKDSRAMRRVVINSYHDFKSWHEYLAHFIRNSGYKFTFEKSGINIPHSFTI